MSALSTDVGSFAVAATASLAATPVAIRVARRTDFLDRPREYHMHASPTPLLGGAAVIAAFLLAALAIAGASGSLLVVLGCAIGLWVLGTIDDRFAVSPKWRLLAEVGAGVALFTANLGWKTALGGVGDLVLTVISVVIAVNAFNLMDNLDGACSSVAAVAAAGIGALAAIRGDTVIAALAFGLAGACAGFVPWNLAEPAKIFLGDGGSMPLGFLVASLAIATSRHDPGGGTGLLAGALLAGLPIFDSTLVSFSRTRRGVPLVTGGRDHLTHRLLPRLHSARAVAAAVALLQALLCGVAIAGHELGTAGAAALAFATFVIGLAAIVVLDTERWRPAGIALVREQPHAPATAAESVITD
jgi:UDP-GlcNAc:undecaprenyl-phosphate/decaprenyl-phosphate GlcNAc-1-phosphate transferase